MVMKQGKIRFAAKSIIFKKDNKANRGIRLLRSNAEFLNPEA